MIDFGAIFTNFAPYLSYVVIGVVIALLATPWIGKLGFRIKAVDLPAHMRGRGDRTVDRRIHDRIVPKLTGLILALPIIIILITENTLEQLPWGILVGGLILLIGGILDDKFDLNGKQQLLIQFLGALVVVLSGVTITYIQVLGVRLDFSLWSHAFQLGNFIYNFIFPADLITIFWIVAVINFVGWSDGVDGVHGALTLISGFTLMFISLKTGSPVPALMIFAALILGGNLGFYPYNLNPAKMFYSGSGTYVNGFFLAVASIMSTSKLATAIITLGVPLFDAFLVILLRIKSNPEVIRNPLKILSISDKNHLHHRLLAVGYSKNNVLLIEVTIMLILCFVALYFSGFENDSLALAGTVILVLIVFSLIAIGKRRADKLREQIQLAQRQKPQIEVKYNIETSTEKFTY